MTFPNILLQQLTNSKQKYKIDEHLADGAFAAIYAATDTEDNNRKVAIKIHKLNSETRSFIENEYAALKNLTNHQNLLEFYGIYKNDDEIWFVMELCLGPVSDLVDRLHLQNRRLREEHIAYILKETVKAIIFLHEKCTIHRDIKTRNILYTKNGEIKLCDFKFSAITRNEFGRIEGCLGSPNWMAPEIITAKRNKLKFDNRIDVWSLGIVAIELGDGKAPYHAMHPTRILFQIVANPPPNLYRTSQWSEHYVDFINECLVKNPEHRPYASELVEHPFLTQIPENNYHLTLELKALSEELSKVDPPKPDAEISVIENCLKVGPEGDIRKMLLEDLATLDEISEKNILEVLEARMKNGNFQTFVGDVLLVLNPFDNSEIFGDLYHEKYQFKSRSENSPHIYSIADSAYQYALHHQIPQKILLAGETGSGKTRNYLHLINHLLYLGHNNNINLERIRGAIKLIHSLTHASTPTNNYSTRCVFKTELKFGTTGKISGAVFNVFQLEKWRISCVDMFQGNYHFLYYIFDGLREMNKFEQYQLNFERKYRYLRIAESATSANNLAKFKKILKIFEDFNMGEDEIDTVFSIVAAILLIGEIRFEESDTGDAFIENNECVKKVSVLLKIEARKFEWALTNYCWVKKGTVVRRKSTVDEARDARDVFANNLYIRLVDYIVGFINHRLEVGRAIFGEKYSVQVLDYFGFECVRSNHLPQLFVNCFNEQLQYHYQQRLFSWEYLDASDEEIEFQPVTFYDNKKTLDQLLTKSEGLFSIIDEASKTGHDGKYITNFFKTNEKESISVLGQSEFSICHYTGKVMYCASEMPDKNRDFLPPEFTETLRQSENPTVKLLFTNKLNKTGNLIVAFKKHEEERRFRFQMEKLSQSQYSQVRKMRTCVKTYKSLSLEILKELSIGSGSGGTHFVRCIRTNLKNEPGTFNRRLVKQQVRALAITETAKARQRGYPHRISFAEFLRRYQFLAFNFDESVEVTKENCRLLLIRLKMEGWSIGKSRVFLKYYNEEYLARLYETHVKKIIKIQSILRRFLAKCLIEKKMTDKERCFISTLGGRIESRRMTEEEAAAIIQKAYRESTMRKSYPDFAKDYKILDDETCEFIKPYADKWRKNSLFHVLVLYRAAKYQDMFNFTQQVHLYNISIFYELENNNEPVALDLIDSKAQTSNWLKQTKIPLRKQPFRLDEIPFYDTSNMCSSLINSGVSVEKDETWDSPYRWRELVVSKPTKISTRREDLIDLPFARDSEASISELSDMIETNSSPKKPTVKIIVEEFVSKEDKEEENKAVRKKITQEAVAIIDYTKQPLSQEQESAINSVTKLANKDFDYIKPLKTPKSKAVDPIVELTSRSQKNISEDDPPFNFQGMLRKTNFNKESPISKDEPKPLYALRKTPKNPIEQTKNEKNSETVSDLKSNTLIENFNSAQKKVSFQLAPGLVIEGIEVEL